MQFERDINFFVDRGVSDNYPLVSFYLGPNKSCLAADNAYWFDKKGIDKTFKKPNCGSKFKGSRQNYEFIDADFRINEYEILEDNGVLEDLLREKT